MIIGSDTVTVRNIAPRADVVFFGRSVTYRGGVPLLARHVSVERDTDGDGVVTLSLKIVPRYSTWVAVDAETGAYASSAPGGWEPRGIVVSPELWRENQGLVDLTRDRIDLLMVRPGKGAWMLDVFQGTARDDDGRNDANLRVRTSSLQTLLGKDSPPPHAAKKDVLVLIDPKRLEIAIVAAQ